MCVCNCSSRGERREERGERSEERGVRSEDWDIGLFIPHSLPVDLLSVTPMAGVVASKVRRAREKDLKEKHKKEEIGMGQLMVNGYFMLKKNTKT